MSNLRTVCVSNALPPSPECGKFAVAAAETFARVARSRGWLSRRFCGNFENAAGTENFFPILVRMDGNSADAKLWRGYRNLSAHAVKTAEIVAGAAESGDALLLLNPCGLSVLEWMFAFTRAKVAIPWIDSDWVLRFPECDPFWNLSRRRRHSLFPGTLIAAALIRSLYGEIRLSPEIFSPVRFAIFASEKLRERNAPAFPNLERSAVIPPAVDAELFPFAETNEARSRVWGWDGGFAEKSGVLFALDAFARQAAGNREMRMLLEGDADSADAENLRAKIRSVAGLSEQIVFVGKIPRERRSRDFFHRVGLYVFIPRDESAFPCAAAEAMACGCLVVAPAGDEMRELSPPDLPLLFKADAPETLRLVSDFVMRISPEEWALTAADGATRIQEKCSRSRVETAFADFLETAAGTPR